MKEYYVRFVTVTYLLFQLSPCLTCIYYFSGSRSPRGSQKLAISPALSCYYCHFCALRENLSPLSPFGPIRGAHNSKQYIECSKLFPYCFYYHNHFHLCISRWQGQLKQNSTQNTNRISVRQPCNVMKHVIGSHVQALDPNVQP